MHTIWTKGCKRIIQTGFISGLPLDQWLNEDEMAMPITEGYAIMTGGLSGEYHVS